MVSAFEFRDNCGKMHLGLRPEEIDDIYRLMCMADDAGQKTFFLKTANEKN